MQAVFFIAFITQLWVGSIGFDFFLCFDHRYYLEEKSNRLIYVEFRSRKIVHCKDFGIISTIHSLFIRLPFHCVTVVNADRIKSVGKLCPRMKKDRLLSSFLVDSFSKLRHKIYPGTYWCGAGNISDSTNDLDLFERVDKCCRAHDMCPDFILAGQTKYGIRNDQSFTISLCECNDKFYQCLQDIGSVASNNVGFTFFNVLAMPCFKEDYPIINCLERGGIISTQCQKYELDTSKEPIYQLFDSKLFYPKTFVGKLLKYILQKN